jgi:hypothetical protein
MQKKEPAISFLAKTLFYKDHLTSQYNLAIATTASANCSILQSGIAVAFKFVASDAAEDDSKEWTMN